MKKAISLFWVLALCLVLCACGVDEQYKPLLEHLDTQNYEGIKNELMVLSPDFKVEQEQMATAAEKLEKYQSLIDLLESENYIDALIDIESRIPAPEYETIEITMDNWDMYFEIVPDYYWYENAFGEGESLCVGFSLFLKDAYAARNTPNSNTAIACTVSFDAREKTLDVNWKEKTFTEVPYTRVVAGMSSSGLDGGRWPEKSFEEGCNITSELKAYSIVPDDDYRMSNLFYICISQYDDTDLYNFYFGENFSMARITGTLELLAE
jgi:hypothetical protein